MSGLQSLKKTENNITKFEIYPNSGGKPIEISQGVVKLSYYENILSAMQKYCSEKSVEGLLFNYLHFCGTYNYISDSYSRYRKEIRIIKNNIGVDIAPISRLCVFVSINKWIVEIPQLKKINDSYKLLNGK